LLQSRCVRCHGASNPKAKLSLADADGLRRGGRHGAVVAPGKPDDSPLWQFVRDGRMPPKEPLAEGERALLRRWIESGAPAPAARAPGASPLPVRPPVSAVNHGERVRTDVDRFIEAALEQKGLTPAPEADRATLVRRVCFDLTGLPPTPAEVDAFVADPAPDA